MYDSHNKYIPGAAAPGNDGHNLYFHLRAAIRLVDCQSKKKSIRQLFFPDNSSVNSLKEYRSLLETSYLSGMLCAERKNGCCRLVAVMAVRSQLQV